MLGLNDAADQPFISSPRRLCEQLARDRPSLRVRIVQAHRLETLAVFGEDVQHATVPESLGNILRDGVEEDRQLQVDGGEGARRLRQRPLPVLCLLALGQVEDEGDNRTGRLVEHREPDQHRDARAVLADVLLLPRRGRPGSARLRDRAIIERKVLGRRQHIPAQKAALQVLATVADQLQQGVVGVHDVSVEVADGDSHDVRVDQPLVAALARPQGCLRLFTLGDVFDYRDEVGRLALNPAHQGGDQVGPHDRAVLAQVALLPLIGGDHTRQQPLEVIEISGQIVGVGQLLERTVK